MTTTSGPTKPPSGTTSGTPPVPPGKIEVWVEPAAGDQSAYGDIMIRHMVVSADAVARPNASSVAPNFSWWIGDNILAANENRPINVTALADFGVGRDPSAFLFGDDRVVVTWIGTDEEVHGAVVTQVPGDGTGELRTLAQQIDIQELEDLGLVARPGETIRRQEIVAVSASSFAVVALVQDHLNQIALYGQMFETSSAGDLPVASAAVHLQDLPAGANEIAFSHAPQGDGIAVAWSEGLGASVQLETYSLATFVAEADVGLENIADHRSAGADVTAVEAASVVETASAQFSPASTAHASNATSLLSDIDLIQDLPGLGLINGKVGGPTDGTPTLWSLSEDEAPTQLSSSAVADAGPPAIASEGGTTAAGWVEAGADGSSVINITTLDPFGAPTGNQVQISAAGDVSQLDMAISGGTILAAYTEEKPDGSSEVNGAAVIPSDDESSEVVQFTIASGGSSESIHDPDMVTRTGDSNDAPDLQVLIVVTSVTDAEAANTGIGEIRIANFDIEPSSDPAAGPSMDIVETNLSGEPVEPGSGDHIIALEVDGNPAVGRDPHGVVPDNDELLATYIDPEGNIQGVIVDTENDGTPAMMGLGDLTGDTEVAEGQEHQTMAMEDGGVLVSWVTEGEGNFFDIVGRILRQIGEGEWSRGEIRQLVRDIQRADDDDGPISFQLTLSSGDDGDGDTETGFTIVYTTANSEGGESQNAQRFDGDGDAIGQTLTISTNDGNTTVAVAALEDGRIVTLASTEFEHRLGCRGRVASDRHAPSRRRHRQRSGRCGQRSADRHHRRRRDRWRRWRRSIVRRPRRGCPVGWRRQRRSEGRRRR